MGGGDTDRVENGHVGLSHELPRRLGEEIRLVVRKQLGVCIPSGRFRGRVDGVDVCVCVCVCDVESGGDRL